MERRQGRVFLSLLADFESARPIKPGRLEPRIRNRDRETAHLHADAKLMLLVRGLPDGDPEFTALIPDCSVYAKHIPLVAVAPLIERSREADAGLVCSPLLLTFRHYPCCFLHPVRMIIDTKKRGLLPG